jgi:hypothetical protein
LVFEFVITLLGYVYDFVKEKQGDWVIQI